MARRQRPRSRSEPDYHGEGHPHIANDEFAKYNEPDCIEALVAHNRFGIAVYDREPHKPLRLPLGSKASNPRS